MDVSFLIKQYFNDTANVSIDVFDSVSLNRVYQDVINVLTAHLDIEVSVLQALSYCFYEILDNVHIHSGKPLGTAITHFDQQTDTLRILVADDGKGIHASLRENPEYKDISEQDALQKCLMDSVTDGKGMGFGLYATSRMMQDIGKKFILHSGHSKLLVQNGQTEVVINGLWEGTIVFMELGTAKEIDPENVVEHRKKASDEYNEMFIDCDELTELW